MPSAPAYTIRGKPQPDTPAIATPGPGEHHSGVSVPTGPAYTMGKRHKNKCCKPKRTWNMFMRKDYAPPGPGDYNTGQQPSVPSGRAFTIAAKFKIPDAKGAYIGVLGLSAMHMILGHAFVAHNNTNFGAGVVQALSLQQPMIW